MPRSNHMDCSPASLTGLGLFTLIVGSLAVAYSEYGPDSNLGLLTTGIAEILLGVGLLGYATKQKCCPGTSNKRATVEVWSATKPAASPASASPEATRAAAPTARNLDTPHSSRAIHTTTLARDSSHGTLQHTGTNYGTMGKEDKQP